VIEETSLTSEEVAGILKIAKNTVYELIKRGELPAYRVGRKIRVDPADVEKYKKLETPAATTFPLFAACCPAYRQSSSIWPAGCKDFT